MHNKKYGIILIAVAIMFATIVAFLVFCGYKTEYGWTCEYTGSHKGHTAWFGFIRTANWYNKSPIEEWLESKGSPVDHKWINTKGTSYYLFGGRSFGHAMAPPIYSLKPDYQKLFIKQASDKEILEFIYIMKNKEPETVEKTVNDIIGKLIESMKKSM
jgi:hypothetical protein